MNLFLGTAGTSLNRECGCFIVKNEQARQTISPSDIKAIHISQGVKVSSDAMMLAIERGIPFFVIDKSGTPMGQIWSPKYGSISTIRKGQLEFAKSASAVDWIKKILFEKIGGQQAVLLIAKATRSDKKDQKSIDKSVERMEEFCQKIKSVEADEIRDVAGTLRGWEGGASKIYFEEFNRLIPREYRFATRSQHPAKDVANAFLNYGYGILYGKVESALIKAGIDPYIGVMHRDDYSKPVLVYDVVEIYRVWIDYVVLNLLNQLDMDDSFYEKKEDGSVYLDSLGRKILIQAVSDCFEEIVGVGVHR